MIKDPLLGGEEKNEFIIRPPPVERLLAIYGVSFIMSNYSRYLTFANHLLGVNLETELGQAYVKDNGSRVSLSDSISQDLKHKFNSTSLKFENVTLPCKMKMLLYSCLVLVITRESSTRRQRQSKAL